MRLLIISKAFVSSNYRRKLTELSRLGIEVFAVTPPLWKEGGSVQALERDSEEGYHLLVTAMRFNGHFHAHYYPELPNIVRRVRPDLIHIDEEPYNLATALACLSARRASIPVVFFTWQNLLRRYPSPFAELERAVYRWSSHALAGSETAAHVLRAKGYAGPITVVPQFGVDPDAFCPGTSSGHPFTVGFPNRLVTAKGPLLTLEAWSTLPSDSRLVFLGTGPLRDQIMRKVRESRWQDRVDVRERLSSSEMPGFYRSLDVVVLPSLSTVAWKEQFGRVLIEAMASGVSVVGSDSGEIPSVIGRAGLIVPEGDVAALAEALQRLQADQALRSRLGAEGRERVLEHFTHARVATLTAHAYRSAVSAAPTVSQA